ncbi:putative taurine catabolism dioxygenase protein [Botrytis fragariae]|uniref:Putative taurine catabolism dioxygenase protein n=1 Tax=Botrytis fragariae TaxID=1964551 RepID=A0A8H6B4I7_9HELO|nr:putative taurine catabolism dioxygenase protein [Botrytis fragariae]KAF5879013.1 putative taurine catabolism dioxygenase protein [Botrytis fragariae]
MHRLLRVGHTATQATDSHFARASPIRHHEVSSLIPWIEVPQPDSAFQPSHLRAVHDVLETRGVLQLQLGFQDEKSTYLQSLIHNLNKNHNHGLPITHSAERGWFWDVRPSVGSLQNHGHQARSETMSCFDWHTDCSYESHPPRYFALQVLQPDRYGGGTLSLLGVDRLLALLSPRTQTWLSSPNYMIAVPPEFNKKTGEQCIVGNLLMRSGGGGSQIRFREDITTPLTLEAAAALEELKKTLLDKRVQEWTLHLTPQSLPRGSIIMMDNRRWLHSRNEVKDPNRHLRRVRWDASPFGSLKP